MIGNIFKRRYHAAKEDSPSHKAKLERQNVGVVVKCGKCGATNKTLFKNLTPILDENAKPNKDNYIDCPYICIDCRRSK